VHNFQIRKGKEWWKKYWINLIHDTTTDRDNFTKLTGYFILRDITIEKKTEEEREKLTIT
jgi:hypothetical protein